MMLSLALTDLQLAMHPQVMLHTLFSAGPETVAILGIDVSSHGLTGDQQGVVALVLLCIICSGTFCLSNIAKNALLICH